MNAFVPYLAALHQRTFSTRHADCGAEARPGSQSNVPAWRRSLGSAFASAARSLDPSVERTNHRRPATAASSVHSPPEPRSRRLTPHNEYARGPVWLDLLKDRRRGVSFVFLRV